MKARVLIILAVLCALLLGAYFLIPALVRKKPENKQPEVPDHEVLVDVSDKDKIDCLSVQKDGGVLYALERRSGVWQSENRSGLRIDDDAIDPLLENLRVVSALSEISSDDPSEFLLDEPAIVITERLTSGGKTIEKVFEIGLFNKSKSAYYARLVSNDPNAYSASGKIWLIPENWVNLFDLSLEDLLKEDVLPDFSDVKAVEGAEIADFGCLKTLRLLDRVDFGSERFAIFGMDDPLVLKITGNDGEHVLCLSSDEECVHLYVRIDDSESIYLLEDPSGVIRSLLQEK